MSNLNNNRDTGKKAWIIGIGILLAIIALVYFAFGIRNIFRLGVIIFIILAVIGAIFALAYLFWYLFIAEHKFDVNYVNKKRLIKAGEEQHREILKDLYISGDKGHSRVKVGKITGYLRTQVPIRRYYYDEIQDEETNTTYKKQRKIVNENGETTPVYTIEIKEQDIFIVQPKGFLSMFKEKMVIRVSQHKHNDLVGDIDLFGFSLIPKGEYHFLNDDILDIHITDYASLAEAKNSLAYEGMKDWHETLVMAMGLDTKHAKQIQGKSLYELPEMSGTNQPNK